MGSSSPSPLVLPLLVAVFIFIFITFTITATCSVTYDHRSIVLNGRRRILISGSIHYPRSVPEMWPDLFKKAKRGGLDVIQTYVFWNGHEPSPGQYYFRGRYDLVRFIKEAHKAGLYVHLRIGPYVCAEWNFGGFPVWLKYVHGISFRTDNGPFKAAMEKFTKKIVSMMKSERLFESQGGPIILSQIENEYGPLESNARDRSYANWAAKMAVGLNTGVPWVMCKQDDAPDPVINTCNGFYCDYFSPNKNYKPTMWTENWTGWFTAFGGATPTRPAEDLAFSVARFIQKGGSFVNYYMYHGGTNFGHTAGGPFITTSYDYDAPIDEYGLLREPKWGHLRDLHNAIKMSEPALVTGRLIAKSLGRYQQSHVFRSRTGACAAFLANYDSISSASVHFGGMHHILPPWSISILPDCKNVVFNTARINTQHSQMKMKWVGGFDWHSYREELVYSDKSFTSTGLREQIGVTWDATDYLWYTTNIDISHGELFLKTGRYPVLTVISASHSLHVFINGHQAGMAYGSQGNLKLTYTEPVKLHAGDNRISVLSVSLGLPNVGRHFEKWNAGILGPVILNGLNEGKRDLTSQKWTYTIGLKGENLNLHSVSGSSSVEWGEAWPKQSLTWYKALFNAPGGNEPLALDMGSMGKGEMWINGRSIGRHWPGYKAQGVCGGCNYAGSYSKRKCNTNCGHPSQRWYHVPRSLLKPEGNLLVVFEEWGGNPKGISLVKRATGSVCAVISEWQPSMKMSRLYGKLVKWQIPKARLWCEPGQKIAHIKFASFGTPRGACGSFSVGRCHARNSLSAFRSCIGRQWCAVYVTSAVFGGDPCPGMMKTVSVEAVCK